MTKKVSRVAAAVLLTLCVCRGASAAKPTTGDVTIIAFGGRALRDALTILGPQLGCSITYEDPQYEGPDAVRELYPGSLLVPQVHYVSFTYDPRGHGSKLAVIQALLDQYRRLDKTALFQVVASAAGPDIFDVLPVQIQDKSGALVPRSPLLDRTISLSANDNIYNLVMRISGLASSGASDPHISFVDPPNEGGSSVKVSITAVNQTVRQCLDELLVAYNAQAKADRGKDTGRGSWLLNADPDWSRDHKPDLDSSVLYFVYFQAEEKPAPGTVSVNIESARPLAHASSVLLPPSSSTSSRTRSSTRTRRGSVTVKC